MKLSLREIFNFGKEIMSFPSDQNYQETMQHAEWYKLGAQRRDMLREFLCETGFRYIAGGAFSDAYGHNMYGGIVAKFAKCNSEDCNVPDFTSTWHNAKTLEFARRIWLKPLFRSPRFLIQPRVDTSSPEKARTALNEIRREMKYDGHHDLHNQNIGFYRGRLVAFDFQM